MLSFVEHAASTTCRACGALAAKELGAVEYLKGFPWRVSECADCGCRFTPHDDAIYDKLHASGAISYYNAYRDLAEECRRYFDAKDLDGLKRALSAEAKYRFVIDRAASMPKSTKVLEIGASRGYLTSFFILSGFDVLGVDVSSDAVASAQAFYGDHFVVANDPAIETRGPYDVIFHVGMIGCVADPIGLTRDLLKLLRPGGTLLFNAPNATALSLRDQLWFDSAPPPDVVTLFRPGFWKARFSDVAEVSEEVQQTSNDEAFKIAWQKLRGYKWKMPEPKTIAMGAGGHSWSQDQSAFSGVIDRGVRKLARASRVNALAPPQPTEFGLFVVMVRH